MTAPPAAKGLKILVTGDVDGKFVELFNRISTVNKKNGPFDMLLCTGNFFPPEESADEVVALLDTIPLVPIPTYILGPTSASQLKYYSNLSGCEIKPNITYLGNHGIYTESSGLRLVYLSGVEQKTKGGPKGEFEFDESDIRKLQIQLSATSNNQNQQGVDILMTSQWPDFVWENAPTKPTSQPTSPSPLLSSLASLLRPRYHFCGAEGLNYERTPYRNHQVLAEAARHVTRFIALGKVGNQTKTKWLYACTVTPMTHMAPGDLVANPADVTDNPYTDKLLLSSKLINEGDESNQKHQQFFYDDTYTGEPDYNYRDRGRGRGRGRGQGQKRGYDNQGQGQQYTNQNQKKFQDRQPPAPCWFCLASPEVEKHLIISIGDSAYITLAKGGLTEDHVLILPIGHFGSTVECQEEILDEINRFKQALCDYFFSRDKCVVFYERNWRSPHLQIQCVPLPMAQFGGSVPKINTFMSHCQDYSESEAIDLQHVPSNVQIFQLARPGFPYFFMEIFSQDGGAAGAGDDGKVKEKTIVNKLFAPIQRGQQFPLQFGRELLGSEAILNLPDRIDWRQCKEGQEEQTKWTQNFRDNFKAFDFTLM